MADPEYLFIYRVAGGTPMSGRGKRASAVYFIVAGTALMMTIFFAIRALFEEPLWWWFALPFGLWALVSGPYALWIRRFYFVGLTRNDQLVLRSIINAIPRAYQVELQQVASIRAADPRFAQALEFLDAAGRRLASFNPHMMPPGRLDELARLLKERNPRIEF